MGRNRLGTLPKITVHPRSGHARVRYNGQEIWLGKHGSKEAQQKYDHLIQEIVSGRLTAVPSSTDTSGKPVNVPTTEKLKVDAFNPEPHSEPAVLTVAKMCSQFVIYAEKEYCRPDGTTTSTLGDIKIAIRALRRYDDMSAASFGPVLLEELMHSLASEKVRCVKNGGKVDYRPTEGRSTGPSRTFE